MQKHVIIDREFRVVFHHRVREIQWNFDQPLPVARHQMHPFLEMAEQRVEIDASLEQAYRSNMQRTALRLGVDKGRVLGGQSIARGGWKFKIFGHSNSPPAPDRPRGLGHGSGLRPSRKNPGNQRCRSVQSLAGMVVEAQDQFDCRSGLPNGPR